VVYAPVARPHHPQERADGGATGVGRTNNKQTLFWHGRTKGCNVSLLLYFIL
jgi:hypothetical protein